MNKQPKSLFEKEVNVTKLALAELSKWVDKLPCSTEGELLLKIDTLLAISKGEYKNWAIYKAMRSRVTPIKNNRYIPIKRGFGSKSTPGRYTIGSINAIVPDSTWKEHQKLQAEFFKELNMRYK